MRKFHGNSVRFYKGHGHDACQGCDCHHSIDVEVIPEVEGYLEQLQDLAGDAMPPAQKKRRK
jgi:hypothetical protein